jgi:hypothetical protein
MNIQFDMTKYTRSMHNILLLIFKHFATMLAA